MIKKSGFIFFLLIFLMLLSGVWSYFSPIYSAYVCSAQTQSSSSSVPVIADHRSTIRLPILMYHGITDVSASVDEYTILADTLEDDLKWLGDNGYTSISVRQLTDYVEKGSALPEKPVLITFDDGYYNNYSLAVPLLKKYHVKAVISVIGAKADISSGDMYRNLSNSSLSWGEIALLASSKNIEIGCHTYDLHDVSKGRNGADKKPGESQQAYEAVLKSDLLSMQDMLYNVTGSKALLFAWPYGACPKDGSADDVLKEAGFKVSVTSYQKINIINRDDPDCLFGLKRFLRTPDFDISDIIC